MPHLMHVAIFAVRYKLIIQKYFKEIDILYTSNILNVRQTRTIANLAVTILPRRLSVIRSLGTDLLLGIEYCQD